MIKQVNQKNVCFVMIDILKTLPINFNHIFVNDGYELKKHCKLNVKGVL